MLPTCGSMSAIASTRYESLECHAALQYSCVYAANSYVILQVVLAARDSETCLLSSAHQLQRPQEATLARKAQQPSLLRALECLDLSKMDAREPGVAVGESSIEVNMDWSHGLGATGDTGEAPSLQFLRKCLNKLANLDSLQLRTSITINWE